VQKFKMEDSKAMATPMITTTTLDADEEGEHVDQKEYRSMIGSLLYLTATRLDIQFRYVCALVFNRLQGLRIGKQSSAYQGTCITLPTLVLQISSLAFHGFSDVDFAACRLDSKSTSGTC
jgi:hypothetical protein